MKGLEDACRSPFGAGPEMGISAKARIAARRQQFKSKPRRRSSCGSRIHDGRKSLDPAADQRRQQARSDRRKHNSGGELCQVHGKAIWQMRHKINFFVIFHKNACIMPAYLVYWQQLIDNKIDDRGAEQKMG